MATTTIQQVKTGNDLGTLANGDMLLGERVAGTGGVVTVTATGTGDVVLSTSPTLVTPTLGTPDSGTLSNCTGLPISTGVSGLAANVATALETPSSANIAAAVTDETGSGSLVFATSPTLVTPLLGTPTSGTLTNCTGLPISTGVSGLAANVATALETPSSANLAAAVTDETGSGSLVFATSPTLTTPILGTPTSGTLTNCTGLPISTGVSGLGTGVSSFLASPSSLTLAQAVTDETGSGSLVFATSPTLTTPILGTPTSGTLTNCTGLPISTGVSGLAANVATALATPSSANLAAAVTDETGSGSLVFATSPTLVTPNLGAATATSITFSPTTGGIVGTTTNDDAGTGKVGEVLSAIVLAGSAVSVSNATSTNIVTLSLTAGHWEVVGEIWTKPAGGTTTDTIAVGVTTASATLPSAPAVDSSLYQLRDMGVTAGISIVLPSAPATIKVSTTTNVYLVGYIVFASSTMESYGKLVATRVR